MPRDPRPYVTFPVGYTGHPRIDALTDSAFRVFHQMNDHSRSYGLDGKFPQAVALKRWPKKALEELVRGVDDRPLVVVEDGCYVLRSYGEHQLTTSDIEQIRSDKARAGAAGGRAKAAAKRAAGAALAGASSRALHDVPESESEELPDVTHLELVSPEGDGRAGETDQELLERLRIQAITDAQRLGITDLPVVRDWLERAAGAAMNMREAVELAGDILARSKGDVRDPDRYVIGVCRKSPQRVAQYAANRGLGEAA